MERKNTKRVTVGGVAIGGGSRITVQSMTNRPAADAEGTYDQRKRLERAGCDIICIAVPDIDTMDGLMHTLFALEDRKLLRITNADGLICLRAEIFDGGIHAADLEQRLRAWQEQSARLAAGEITKEAYDRWRYHYPDFDDTRIHAAVPPEAPAKRKRGRKPKPKA